MPNNNQHSRNNTHHNTIRIIHGITQYSINSNDNKLIPNKRNIVKIA
jgi:hypothetical protein